MLTKYLEWHWPVGWAIDSLLVDWKLTVLSFFLHGSLTRYRYQSLSFCLLWLHHRLFTISTRLAMGVGAQNDLGGHQSFARKMTWKLPDKSIVFFCQNKGDLQKKKVFTHVETVFLFSARNIFLVGKLARTTWTCPKFWRKIAQKDMKLPEILTQNRPKFCSKFRHLTSTGGAGAPPPPTPMRLA